MGTAATEEFVPDEKKQKAALAEIDAKVKQAYALISECEEIAKRERVSFNFSVAYGMGGSFQGNPDDFYDPYGNADGETTGWQPSSQSC